MAKQDKIKEVYGEHWESIKDFVDENGRLKVIWGHISFYPQYAKLASAIKNSNIEFEGDYYARPKSLQGIEDNNGWTKIESEDDLPKEKGLICEFLNKNKKTATYVSVDRVYDKDWFLRRYTHWRPKEILKLPIY